MDSHGGCRVVASDGRWWAERCSSGRRLTEVQAAVLLLERSWWNFTGAREAAVLEKFGGSPTRYYQVLNVLIDSPDALAADPCHGEPFAKGSVGVAPEMSRGIGDHADVEAGGEAFTPEQLGLS